MCDCGPILKSLSMEQLTALKNHMVATANKRSIKLGVNMEAAHSHNVDNAAPASTAPAAEVKVEAKTEEVKVEAPAVSEKTEAKTEAPVETKVEAPTEKPVEMVALSEKKAVEDKLVAKEAELETANTKAKNDLEAARAEYLKATDKITALSADKAKAEGDVAELNKNLTAVSGELAKYKEAFAAVIPQDKLSEAVLKAASGIVAGYDATKKVADQAPDVVVKLLAFSAVAQSTNAGAVETTVKRKKPEVNLVFEGITIKKKQE